MEKNHAHIQIDPDLLAHHDPLSKIAEAYKIARTNVEFAMLDKKLKTISVTSAQQGEGKTVTIANLAISYAQAGRRILLVDADLRRPSIHRRFGLPNRQGLTTAIVRGSEPQAFVQDSKIPNLSVLTSGPIPPNPAEMLMSETLWRLIDELKTQYDLIFFDASPVGVVTDAAIIATRVDGTIFVVRAGEIKKAQLTRATDLMKKVNAHVLGFILNGASKQTDDYYNYYYYNTYYYSSEPHPADAKRAKKRRKRPAQREQSGRFRELERNFYQAAGQSGHPASLENQPGSARSAAPSFHIDTHPVTSPAVSAARPLSGEADKAYQSRTGESAQPGRPAQPTPPPVQYASLVRRPDVHFGDPNHLTSEED